MTRLRVFFVSSFELRHSTHMLDHVVAKLRALDFGRAFHQPREIVRNAFARDRAA